MKINGMEIEFEKGFYQASKVKEDGITHIIDTEHEYPFYQVSMFKNYFNIKDETELATELIKDLKGLITELEQLQHRTNLREKEK